MEVELDMGRKIKAKNILDEVAQGKRWFITETVQYATIDVLYWMRCIQDEKQRFIDLNEKLKKELWEWSTKYAALQAERDELSTKYNALQAQHVDVLQKYENLLKDSLNLHTIINTAITKLEESKSAVEVSKELITVEATVPESKPKTRSRNRAGTPSVAEAV